MDTREEHYKTIQLSSPFCILPPAAAIAKHCQLAMDGVWQTVAENIADGKPMPLCDRLASNEHLQLSSPIVTMTVELPKSVGLPNRLRDLVHIR